MKRGISKQIQHGSKSLCRNSSAFSPISIVTAFYSAVVFLFHETFYEKSQRLAGNIIQHVYIGSFRFCSCVFH